MPFGGSAGATGGQFIRWQHGRLKSVADEIDVLYANDFDFDFAPAHVESVFAADPELPGQRPERTEHKRYRLSPKPRPC